MSILTEAEYLIYGERAAKYGPASDTFQRAAWILTQLTGKQWCAQDILKCQIILKLIRNEFSPDHIDNLRDACGYIGILSDIQEKKNEQD